jgi:hypothetical protein
MHNIDRTTLESAYDEYEGEFEMDGSEIAEEGDYESDIYSETGIESPFSEAEEMDLAAELLTIQSDAELDQFFGSLFKKAKRLAGGIIKSPVGRALGGALKGIAKKALPVLGSTVGNALVPGIGGVVGGRLAGAAGRMFGLELEGLSQDDQEFEVAKQVVRLAGAAAANAAQAPPTAVPQQVAQAALTNAAQQYAPGLLRRAAGAKTGGRACAHKSNGRWVRRGKAIILMGA